MVIQNSTKEAICAVNVFGNSLIDHSSFVTDFETFLIGHGINYTQCMLNNITLLGVILF